MENASEIRDLLRKVKTLSVNSTPQSERPAKKKRKRGGEKKGSKRIGIINKTLQRYVDFSCKSYVHKGRPATITIELKGHIDSMRVFNDTAVHPTQDKIVRAVGLTNDKRLVVDLRRLFFVSYETALSLAAQHLGWIHMRFSKVCVVLPPSKYVRDNLAKAFADSGYRHRDEWVVVERARDVENALR